MYSKNVYEFMIYYQQKCLFSKSISYNIYPKSRKKKILKQKGSQTKGSLKKV